MAKKMSKGGKRFLSLIFHLVVLAGMVTAYESARALTQNDKKQEADSGKNTKDDKAAAKKNTAKQDTIKPDSKPVPKGLGTQVHDTLTQTKGKVQERGTSMEDLMAAKKQRELEKNKKEKEVKE